MQKLIDLKVTERKSAESILPSFKENADSNKIPLTQKNVQFAQTVFTEPDTKR